MAETKPLKIASGLITELGSSDTIPAANLPSVAMRTYPITIRDCSNTASLTDVIEASIPANEWGDGQKITIDWVAEFRNLGGGSPTLLIRVYYGTSYVELASADAVGSGLASIPYQTEVWRFGSELWVPGWDYSQGHSVKFHGGAINAVTGSDLFSTAQRGGKMTGQTFTTEKALKIAVQWSGAASGRFYTTKGARVWKM